MEDFSNCATSGSKETIADGIEGLNNSRRSWEALRAAAGNPVRIVVDGISQGPDLEKVINDAGKIHEGGDTFVSQGYVWPTAQLGDRMMSPFSDRK